MHNSCLGSIRFNVKCVNELTKWLLNTGKYVLNVCFGYFCRFNVKKRKWCINYFLIEIYRYLGFYIFLARGIICELHLVALVYSHTRLTKKCMSIKDIPIKIPFSSKYKNNRFAYPYVKNVRGV